MSDFRMTEGQRQPLPPDEKRRRRRRIAAATAGMAASVVVIGCVLRVPRIVSATGYVTHEHYAEVRAPAVGVVARILKFTGDAAREGEVMVELEDSAERAAMSEAQGRVRRAEAQLALARAEAAERSRSHTQAVESARIRLEHAATRRDLVGQLSRKGLASAQTLEDERLKERLAALDLKALEARDPGLDERRIAVCEADVQAARDGVETARARLAERRVLAPIGGKAVRYEFVVGELVKPDGVLYEIFGGGRQVLRLRVPERHAVRVQPGQRYRAVLRPYRGLRPVRFSGRVEATRDLIQLDAGQTYRTVYCSFDPAGREVPPGTTAEADIDVGRVSLWRRLFGL